MDVNEEAQQIISDNMLYLYKYDPFYAYMLAQMRFKQSADVPTLGVGYENGTIKLVYNPQFIVDHKDMALDLLKHECGHVLHKHLLMKPQDTIAKTKVMNVAMDSVINGYLDTIAPFTSPAEDIVKGEANPNKPYVGPSKDLYNPTTEEVYKHLIKLIKEEQKQQEQGDVQKNGNAGSLDDHSMFGNIDEQEGAIINKAIVEQAVSKSKGNVPWEVHELVEGILKSHTHVNWRQELRKFSGQAIENGRYRTITKPNKKYGYPFFGKRTKYVGEIAVSVDVSGSVSNEDLTKFVGEMHNISKQTGLRLLVVQSDTEVSDVSRYSRSKLKHFVRSACGGTELQPGINAAAKAARFVVVFTDGYASVPQAPKRTHLMFVLLKNHDTLFAEEAKKIGKVVVMND